MKDIILVYHRKDMDGFTSGAIARRYFRMNGYNIREIPFDYYDQFPTDVPDGSQIIFMDVVIQPYTEMTKLRNRCRVSVIDHHKSWIEDFPDAKNFPGLTSTEASGCMLTWKYYFPKIPMPRLVELLGKFDIWDQTDSRRWEEQIVPANMGALGQNVHPSIRRPGQPVDNFLDKYLDDYFTKNNYSQDALADNLIDVGVQIWNYVYLDDAQTAKASAIECTFEGFPAICINSRRNSFVFDTVFDPKRHYMQISWYRSKGGKYSFSLYCPDPSPEKDLTTIAKKFGGGGHAGACGFAVDYVTFIGMRGIGPGGSRMVALLRDEKSGNFYHPDDPKRQFQDRGLVEVGKEDQGFGAHTVPGPLTMNETKKVVGKPSLITTGELRERGKQYLASLPEDQRAALLAKMDDHANESMNPFREFNGGDE